MKDYILLMHNDALVGEGNRGEEWGAYITRLRQAGNFEGGSAIGEGICISKSGSSEHITQHLSGYIRIRANNLSHAQELVMGNPAFEVGGTVEIRELPES
jgi:hypothetical protein